MRDPLLTDLGNRMKKERASRSMNQDEMSELCGVDRTYLSDIERGRRNITILTLKKIASGLKLPLHALLCDF